MSEAIRDAIKELGSQQNLAKVCGVSQNSISKWLKGKTKPRLEKAIAIDVATNGKAGAVKEFYPNSAIEIKY